MLDIRRFSVAVALTTSAAVPAAAQSSAPRALTQPAATAVADAPAVTFWQMLNDSTLDRLMDQALRGSLELRAAAARLDGAGAARTQAALELVPSINASAGYTRQRLASAAFPGGGAGALPDQDVWSSGLNAVWEVDVFGRLRGGLRAQNALLDASREDVRDAQVDLAAAVASTYFALRGAQNQLAVARRNADNQRRTLELTQTRLDAGRGTAFDTERARAQLAFTLAAIPVLEANVAEAQYRIAVFLGRSPQELAAELATDGPLPELPADVPALATADAIRTRPDVRGAQDRVAASRALVSSARADYLPRLSLAAGAGYIANAFDSFGNSGTFNYTFGPVVSWSGLDIGRVKARVDQARAQELEAKARYEQTVLSAAAELEATAVRYRSARVRLDHLREAAAASERAASLARLRYEGGIADFLQVLDAERTLLAAQDQLAQAQTQAVDAYVALFRARGAAWPTAQRGR
jgi:multidrug efflux system outer membrane protein